MSVSSGSVRLDTDDGVAGVVGSSIIGVGSVGRRMLLRWKEHLGDVWGRHWHRFSMVLEQRRRDGGSSRTVVH